MRRFARVFVGGLFMFTCLSGSALAQSARTIKLVVPFPPGGTTDILARVVGEQVHQANHATVVIENRPGAGTIIATEYASRAPSDGNTLLFVANSFVINPYLRKLNYDPLTGFTPICELVTSPQVIVVNSNSPYQTLADLVATSKSKPDDLTMASVGPATTQHIGVEQLKIATKAPLTYVPFPGGAPAINALLGNHVTAVFGNYSEAFEHINTGKLRALATTSRARIAPLPDTPTVAELGYPGYDVEVWFGLVTPAGTPQGRVAELGRYFTAAMEPAQVKDRLTTLGLYPAHVCGPDFSAMIRKKYDDYGRIVREANIRGD